MDNKENNNIGELITFPELLNRPGNVVIPKVQRDYAYGRQEPKVQEIVNGMLDSMLDAVKNDKSIILDFIYGGPDIKEDMTSEGLIPLDGQQRLTTLWLLYFYASVISKAQTDEVKMLNSFSYATRQSANEFCHDLVNGIRTRILAIYEVKKNFITELIKDDALYRNSYDNDPTIVSMINVLDIIERKCKEFELETIEPSLWNRLVNRKNIRFYELPLDDFGLTDDLYIKMNSRGKRLTKFEIFKADMIAQIKTIEDKGSNLAEKITQDLDSKWIDIPWSTTNKDVSEGTHKISDVTAEVDSKYENLVKNIFSIYAFRKGLPSPDEPSIKEVFSCVQSVKEISSFLDVLHNIYKISGFNFDNIWNKFFYNNGNIIGEEDKIRVKTSNVFTLAMNRPLYVQEKVLFYSLYLLYKDKMSDSDRLDDLRIIRNLITTNVRLVDARAPKVHGFLTEVEFIIKHHGVNQKVDKNNPLILDDEAEAHSLAFNQNAWNEEFIKLQLPKEVNNKLLRYENHDILESSLSLFMDYCDIADNVHDEKVIERFVNLLDKFEHLFDNQCQSKFTKIRTSFLNKDFDYLQYDSNSKNNFKGYFLTGYKKAQRFFIKYVNRRNQTSILKILEEMSIDEELKEAEEKYKGFDNDTDWQYYLAKYPEASNFDSTYGIGVWDNKNHWPLDLILLNSSYHSADNLEWKMMNLTVFNLLGDQNIYKIERHGSSPLEITSTSSTIDFQHNKWIVHTAIDLNEVVNQIEDVSFDQITDKPNLYEVKFNSPSHKMDYVELGKKLAIALNISKI